MSEPTASTNEPASHWSTSFHVRHPAYMDRPAAAAVAGRLVQININRIINEFLVINIFYGYLLISKTSVTNSQSVDILAYIPGA